MGIMKDVGVEAEKFARERLGDMAFMGRSTITDEERELYLRLIEFGFIGGAGHASRKVQRTLDGLIT